MLLSCFMYPSSATPSHCFSWWGFVVNRLKMHLEVKIRGQRSWSNCFLLLQRGSYFPALSSVLPASDSWALWCCALYLCPVPFLLPSLHQFWHPSGSSLRWFSSLSLHKTIDVLWPTSFTGELVSYVSAYKRRLNASASVRVRQAWPPLLGSGELPDMKRLLTDWLCMNSEVKCVSNDWREFHPTSKNEDQ